jgi:glycosyltransferase involved in cell wall biosynthesis
MSDPENPVRFLLVTSLRPSGPIAVVKMFLLYQAKRGIRWNVVYLRGAFPQPDSTDFFPHNLMPLKAFLLFIAKYLYSCLRLGRSYVPTLLFFGHGILPDLYALAARFALSIRPPILCSTLHNAAYQDYFFKWGNIGRILAFIHCRLLDYFDCVYCCSPWLVEYYSGLVKPQRLVCVPNSAYALEIIQRESLPNCDGFMPASHGVNFRVMSSCVLSNRKNVLESLSFLGCYAKSCPIESPSVSITYSIAGDGPDIGLLRSTASRFILSHLSISFLGALSQPCLFSELASSDIYISSSLSEGSPLGVLEALLLGCCAVLSDIPAHRDIVTRMNCGWIYLYRTSSYDSFSSAFKSCVISSTHTSKRFRSDHASLLYSPWLMEKSYHDQFVALLS